MCDKGFSVFKCHERCQKLTFLTNLIRQRRPRLTKKTSNSKLTRSCIFGQGLAARIWRCGNCYQFLAAGFRITISTLFLVFTRFYVQIKSFVPRPSI